MKNKRIIALLTACFLVLPGIVPAGIVPESGVSITAGAEETGTYGSLTYLQYTNHVEIARCEKTVTEITIPSDINGLPVTILGDNSFKDCTQLTSVSIPDSVTIMGSGVFWGCISLKEIVLPDSITVMGRPYRDSENTEMVRTYSFGTFCGCTSLTSVVLPKNIKFLYNSEFGDCVSLKSVTLPETLTKIGYSSFWGCTALQSLTIPENVNTIQGSAFAGCTSLNSLYIPEKVTAIDSGVFKGCTNLNSIDVSENNPNYTSVDGVLYNKEMTELFQIPGSKTEYTIPDTVTVIKEEAGYGCSRLKNIVIPEGVTEINYYAFRDCTALESVALPESLETIGFGVFHNTALTSVAIPANVTGLGVSYSKTNGVITDTYINPYAAFSGCTTLNSIQVDENNPNYASISGVL